MYLIVYGLLKTGGSLDHYLPTHSSTPIALSGWKMHDLGAFPGVVPGTDDDVIYAELKEFNLSEIEEVNLLADLDAVEGVKHGLYRRSSVSVHIPRVTNSPELCSCWIYVYNGDVTGCTAIERWKI
jgi:gamma-glutamylcyclotransferase (GGCT)/AIG2-like uncharacterized protein YtfP